MPGVWIPPTTPGKESPIDPTWINAASNVLGKALGPAGGGGPSRSDTGGYFDFGDSPFVVTTGAGNASAAAASGSSNLLWALAAAVIGSLAWKLAKKS